jgi:hypothetical protein
VSSYVFKHQRDPRTVVVRAKQHRHVGIGRELTDYVSLGSVHARALIIVDGADRLDKGPMPVRGHHPVGSTRRETARLRNSRDYGPTTDDGFDASPHMRWNLRPGDPYTRSNRIHLLMLAECDGPSGDAVSWF